MKIHFQILKFEGFRLSSTSTFLYSEKLLHRVTAELKQSLVDLDHFHTIQCFSMNNVSNFALC